MSGAETKGGGTAAWSDPWLSLWTLPLAMARTVHDAQIQWLHRSARSFWHDDQVRHHEEGAQLEIPEDIANAPEQDLFA